MNEAGAGLLINDGAIINFVFNFGDQVYVRSDKDQLTNFITGILIRGRSISYGASLTGCEKWYFDFELSKERIIE